MVNKLRPVSDILQSRDRFNELLISFIDPLDKRLKTLDIVTAHWLKNRQLGRIELDNPANCTDAIVLQESIDYIRELNVSSDFLIYPASRMSFFKEFFLFTPVLNQALYDAVQMLDCIKGVGAGRGYATLYKPLTEGLTEEQYESLTKNYFPDIILDAIKSLNLTRKPPALVSAVDYTALLHHEVFYYQDLVASLNKVIDQKDAEISALHRQNYITTQLTWR